MENRIEALLNQTYFPKIAEMAAEYRAQIVNMLHHAEIKKNQYIYLEDAGSARKWEITRKMLLNSFDANI